MKEYYEHGSWFQQSWTTGDNTRQYNQYEAAIKSYIQIIPNK